MQVGSWKRENYKKQILSENSLDTQQVVFIEKGVE